MNEARAYMDMPVDAVLEGSDDDGPSSAHLPAAKRPKRACGVEEALSKPMRAVPAQTVSWQPVLSLVAKLLINMGPTLDSRGWGGV